MSREKRTFVRFSQSSVVSKMARSKITRSKKQSACSRRLAADWARMVRHTSRQIGGDYKAAVASHKMLPQAATKAAVPSARSARWGRCHRVAGTMTEGADRLGADGETVLFRDSLVQPHVFNLISHAHFARLPCHGLCGRVPAVSPAGSVGASQPAAERLPLATRAPSKGKPRELWISI